MENEKYKGDILLGKTFTTDPISKRRLANMGEENQYYLRDHHEPIVSREIWDKAEEIRMKRSRNKVVETTGNRERYTRQYHSVVCVSVPIADINSHAGQDTAGLIMKNRCGSV